MTSRADIETVLIARVGGWMANCGLDGTTHDGTNADLNDPIGYAVRASGGTVTSLALVTDADVATVEAAKIDQLIDLAELRTLESCLSNYILVDAKAGPVEAKASQFADRLMRVINDKQASIATIYGLGSGAAFAVQSTRRDGYWEIA